MPYMHETDFERKQALYDFLLLRGDQWTTMEQTTDSILLYPAFFKTNYHNSWTRRLLTYDIQCINDDPDHEKIIISGPKGIKLASETEFMKFIRAELREIFTKLARVRRMLRKAKRDQQIKIEGEIVNSFMESRGSHG